MSANFNPFARSQMKIVEPLQLVSCEYDGWTKTYKIGYRATRSAAQIGLLQKQFKAGTPLVVHQKHVVVTEANFTHRNNTVDEVSIQVVAVDFAALMHGLSNPGNPGVVAVLAKGPVKAGELVSSVPGAISIPKPTVGRRILK